MGSYSSELPSIDEEQLCAVHRTYEIETISKAIPLVRRNSKYPSTPLVVLVQDPKANRGLLADSMDMIEDIINKMAATSLDWLTNPFKSRPTLSDSDWVLISTMAISQCFIDLQLSLRQAEDKRFKEWQQTLFHEQGHDVPELGTNKKLLTGPTMAQYMTLLRCNEGMKDEIDKYMQQSKARCSNTVISASQPRDVLDVPHHLLILNSVDTNRTKYLPAIPRSFIPLQCY